jgi:Lar family restriction alleviation protein
MTALERCPFCGGEAHIVEYSYDPSVNGDVQIECSCGVSGKLYANHNCDIAVSDWNRRTPDYKSLAKELAEALVIMEKLVAEYHKRDMPMLSVNGLRVCDVCAAMGKATAALLAAGVEI